MRPHPEASGVCNRAHLVSAPIPGGVVHHVLDLVRFDPGPPPAVVLPPWPGLDRAAQEFAVAGATVVRLAPAPRPGGTAEWLARRPVDLVHVHYAAAHDGTPAVAAALAAGIAVVSTDHACSTPPATPDEAARWQARRRVAGAQAALLADSHAVAAGLSSCLGVPVRVMAHAIDCDRYAAVPPRAAARLALGLSPTARIVASIGGLFSAKGMHRLVDAVAVLRPATMLVIAGEGPERPRLVTRARDLGVDVRLLGWLDDVRPLLAACDVFALASDSEGLPSVVLQAMAAGVPVVATDVGGVREALGEHGFPVPPDDVAALVRALARALDGVAATQLAAARRRVRQRFDARRLAGAIAALHAEVLGGRNRTRSLG